MAIGIRHVVTGTNDGSSASVSATTDSSPQVNDVVFAIHCNDFYALTNMVAPSTTSGSTGSWTQDTNTVADGGTNLAHIKLWWAVVTGAGAITVSTTETGSHDEEKALTLWVLSGVDTTTPIDGTGAGASGAASTSCVCPSISPAQTDSLLICHTNSGGGSSTTGYTTPGGMTEQFEIHVGGLAGVGAYQQLAASGATGTRTFTAANSIPWAGISFAVKTAAGGGGATSLILPRRPHVGALLDM